MSTPGEDQRWRARRGTPQQNSPGNSQQSQQGQRRNQSRDRNSYPSPSGYQGGNRDGGNAWANRGPTQGQQTALVDVHVPVRGFNSREVSEYLNRGFVAALNAAQAPHEDEALKPMIYKSPQNAWITSGRTGSGAWPKQHVMANGTNFLNQLRKGVMALPAEEKK
ncbi:hypothetical protein EV426DRAFT_169783 [Tirmania nivea]|nr:hypothetical protein EV426DRAFT_169783 [Tirmania nivea]